MEGRRAINPNQPLSEAWVKENIQDARFCELMMVLTIKNIESPQLTRWKARGVARGEQLRGVSGEKIVEDLQHVTPASLEVTKLGFGWEMMVGPEGVTLQGDVEGAYLTAALVGPRTFLRIAKSHRQKHWKNWDKISDPVLETFVGNYGLPRGDTCWGGR